MRILLLIALLTAPAWATPPASAPATPAALFAQLQAARAAQDGPAIERLLWLPDTARGHELRDRAVQSVLQAGGGEGDWAFDDAGLAWLVAHGARVGWHPSPERLKGVHGLLRGLTDHLGAARDDPSRWWLVLREAKVVLVRSDQGWRLLFWEHLPRLAQSDPSISDEAMAQRQAKRARAMLLAPPTGPSGAGVQDVLAGGAPAERPAARAKVRLGRLEVQGSLTDVIVYRVVRRHTRELKDCAQTLAPDDPLTLRFGFTIDAQGRVQQVKRQDEADGGPAAECMARRLARLRFPESKEGASAQVTLPITVLPAR